MSDDSNIDRFLANPVRFISSVTERVRPSRKFQTYIREVSGSNLGRENDYLEVFCDLSKYLHVNVGTTSIWL